MPKLKDISVNAGANNRFDITFNAQYPCKVLPDGVFYAELPDEALHEFKTLFSSDRQRDVALADRVALYRDKKGVTHLIGQTLGSVTKALNDHGKMKVSTTREVEHGAVKLRIGDTEFAEIDDAMAGQLFGFRPHPNCRCVVTRVETIVDGDTSTLNFTVEIKDKTK